MYRLQALGAVLPVYAPVDESASLYRMVSQEPCFQLNRIAAGDSVSIGSLDIQVGEARHPVPAVGFRVSGPGGDFGYTGDTNTLPSLTNFYRGCRLLLADGLFPVDQWSEQKPHLSAALAAKLAAEAGCEQLIITHLNPFIPSAILLEEARREFRNVSLASEGMMFSV
jgi:ribonuclease BN (tRNA processing enzyme)